jgi:hypothetical protein
MNKEVTERLVPAGEYIDALNVRLNSTETGDVGAVENSKGNEQLIALQYLGLPLSAEARCIGAYSDSARETLYWFVHDPANAQSATGLVDMVVSYNVDTSTIRYHLVSLTTLNFSEQYLITGVSMVEDLLFWTDNRNPPRKINVKRTYGVPAGGIDGFVEDDISVIVKPPSAAPDVQLTNVPGEENFLEDRFISFAYRYKYLDGEYSALSQFSEVAFQPSPFDISDSQVLNAGMENFFNSCNVVFNTGPERVTGVDIVFKLSDDPVIRIINRYSKFEEGWASNSLQVIQFTNKQIYTILPESETLRLYDNVPLLAKAQTMMGNRLMYGNYVEGYDIVDNREIPIDINFSAELISEDIGYEERLGTASSAPQGYLIDGTLAAPLVVNPSLAEFNFAGLQLTAGSAFSFTINLAHYAWGGASGSFTPEDQIDPFAVSFVFILSQNYDNVYDLVTSTTFQEQIGTNAVANFQPIANCGDGGTLTDIYNCQVIPPNGWNKTGSGISNLNQGIYIDVDPASPDSFGVQLMAFQYTEVSTSNVAYEYFKVTNASLTFLQSASGRSLHSNRDFELGIIYMDDYKRSSTALVSNNNSVFVPVSASDKANHIRVTIPASMPPPVWASSYKFALKPTKTFYQTIYALTYYDDPDGDGVWLKLDGENQGKVEVGDEWIVKSDSTGPLNNLVSTAVLDKESFARDDFFDGSLPGVYAKVIPDNFAIIGDSSSVNGCYPIEDDTAGNNPDGPYVEYPVSNADGPWQIGVGSLVSIRIRAFRAGVSNNCGCLTWSWGIDEYPASTSYNSLKEFWDTEGIAATFESALDECVSQPDDFGPTAGVYYNNLPDRNAGDTEATATTQFGVTKVQFVENSSSNALWLTVRSGITPCSGLFGGTESTLEVEVCINNARSPLVFETKPADALPDVFFEGSQTFNIVNSRHEGNVQNQTAAVPAISDLTFFDCFSFGNGVESYRAKDSILGKYFVLGQRVTTTASQDYKRAHRFADITYSGIYNDESNINKLNEFNGGLLNFKALEDIYGPIQRMEGRETDILTLQEDKISYVLTGKDLLSDAGGGGALTSVPTVLGQQIARPEEYGISFHPESYAKLGYDKYFTDAKRGAVIVLRGSSAGNEQLEVISKMGMRSYFRDLFISSINTQKLGGYDPYTDEYVLHSNDINKPQDVQCLECNIDESVYIAPNSSITLCFNSGGLLGNISADITVGDRIPDSSVTATLSGDSSDTGVITSGGTDTLIDSFTDPLVTTYQLVIENTEDVGAYVDYYVECPEVEPMTIKVVTISSNSQQSQTVTHQFYWDLPVGVDTYTSPQFSEQVTFGTSTDLFTISQCTVLSGVAGSSYYPAPLSTLRITTDEVPSDTYDVDLSHYRVYTAESATDLDLCDFTILDTAISTGVLEWQPPQVIDGTDTPINSFEIGATTEPYLFIVFDYRKSYDIQLCQEITIGTPREGDISKACCDCKACSGCVRFSGTPIVSLGSSSCFLSTTETYYHNGGGDFPTVGDRVYTNEECTTPAIYGKFTYALDTAVFIELQIGSNGLVLAENVCYPSSVNYTITSSVGWATEAEACASDNTVSSVLSGQALSALAVGSLLWYNNGGTPLVTLPPGYYKLSNNFVYRVGLNGVIDYKSPTTC